MSSSIPTLRGELWTEASPPLQLRSVEPLTLTLDMKELFDD
jgi:hypothetical protein